MIKSPLSTWGQQQPDGEARHPHRQGRSQPADRRRQQAAEEIKARITRLYNWSKAEAEKPEGQQPSMMDLWEAQQQLKRPDTRTGKIRALQESAALFNFLNANGIQSMQQLHEKIAGMNTRYYDLRREIVKASAGSLSSPSAGRCGRSTTSTRPFINSLPG